MARDPSRDAHSGYVGSGSRLSGRLNAPGPFNVNGEFVGEIHSEDEVSVGNSGNFDGRIYAQRVVVEGGGRVSGEIAAQDVIVHSGGSIAGVAVQAANLTLEAKSDADGAHFRVHRDYKRSPSQASANPAPPPPASEPGSASA
ncbi:MAG: polymer-forming cytoskeletal protein [Acidobacteriota bacterium]|nr:polymer-forming cytoskeletal protein [Acidobacteriota bacterium]MDE2971828.1 polymer-forming cytoskeletal protein [Acidobacteriota bacterium]MDE3261879.1 polymer-forming cytoskeletal protein [Acidobacteriota bacterium]